MKKKIIIVFVTMLLIATTVLPAVGKINEKMYPINDTLLPPSTAWRKFFGGNEFDHFHSVRPTDDGGYIASGITEESNEYFVWIVKLDSNGEEEWRKINYDLNGTYITNTEMWVGGFDVIETSDNGFLITGIAGHYWEYEEEIYFAPTGYFWKTDNNGNTEWVNYYYDENWDEMILGLYFMYNVVEVDDGFAAAAAIYYYNTSGPVEYSQGAIIKTDLSGNELWISKFGQGSAENSLSSINETSDGGYFLGGFQGGEEFEGDMALWMVKTEDDGELDWEQIYDGPNFEFTSGKGFHETSDGGYIMNGVTNSYGMGFLDIWVIKTDKNGKEDWSKTYGGKNNDYCWAMCPADNDGFALGICLNYGGMLEDDDVIIIECDENGNIEWESRFENDGIQVTRTINPTDDGGYIVSGMTSTEFGDPECDAFIYKINPFDNGQPSKPTISGTRNVKADREYTYTASSSDPDGQQLFYMWDWGDGNYSEWDDSPRATYSWPDPEGIEIRVLVKDFYGYESEWSDSFKTKPYTNTLDIPIFDILKNHPLLFQLFQRFLNL
jgi:hypothetical protein